MRRTEYRPFRYYFAVVVKSLCQRHSWCPACLDPLKMQLTRSHLYPSETSTGVAEKEAEVQRKSGESFCRSLSNLNISRDWYAFRLWVFPTLEGVLCLSRLQVERATANLRTTSGIEKLSTKQMAPSRGCASIANNNGCLSIKSFTET